ncbi:MAG: polyhydroxyalkanoate synthesis regulator DNA-binding domain-containing protein [Candidatus Zeuxoniibacter abyssi]|nr:MAG: polyhydroxyalkanoate synthesis regulator DNA-binding domain-containing protein [Candidatus Persebacteraceae bacterium AB1(2)]
MSKRRVIKKYFNRRLYDTEKSRYITLEELRDMVLEGTDFCVLAAKTNDDITAQTLLHVLLSEEMFGEPFFSEQSLRNLIMFMRGPMRGPMSVFFDQCMPSFINAHKSFSAKLGASATPAEMENLAMLQGRLIKQMLEQYVFRGLENYLDTQQKMQQGMEQMMSGSKMFDMSGMFSPPGDDDERR